VSRAERTVKDAAKLYGSQLAGGLFAVVFSAWLARNLPSAELALWPICITLAAIVQVLASFGLGDLLVRLLPGLLHDHKPSEAGALLRTALIINAVATLLLTGTLVLAAGQLTSLLLDNEVDPVLVRMLGVAVLFTAIYKHLERALYAVQEFGAVATIRLMSQICRPSLAVALYMLAGIKGAIVALSVVPLGAAAAAMIALVPYVTAWGRPHRPAQVVKQALPFYGAALANLGTSRLDYLIVGALTTPASLAGYYVARKLADYLRHLNVAIIEAIEPKLSEQRGEAAPRIEATFTRCSRYLFLGLGPLHVGLAVTAPAVITLYAGDNYPAAAPTLSLLCLALFFETIAGLHRAHVKVFANRWHLTALDAASGLTSVGLSALFVLWLGAIGVALAQALAYIVQAALALVLLRQILTVRYDPQAVCLSAVANGLLAVLTLICMAVIPGLWSMPVAIMVGIAGYIAALTGRLKQEDTALLVRVIPFGLVKGIAGRLHRSPASSS